MGNFNEDPKKTRMQGIITLLLIAAAFMLIFFFTKNPLSTQSHEISYSEFLTLVEKGKVTEVVISGYWITGTATINNKLENFKTYIPYDDPDLIQKLEANNVRFKGQEVKDTSNFWFFILMIGSSVFLIFIIFNIFSKQIKGTNSQAFSFGKSKARMYTQTNVKFTDVAGVDEAKLELMEVVEYLKNPMKFMSLGAKIPRGVLLVGPPGCGKTLLAKAVAGEAGVPFYTISGSDFVEMFVGVGASRVRDLFQQAKKNSPSIIFIDELDAVGRSRGAGLGGGHDEREQTLNQLLVEMDGFESTDSVIVMAATNRPDILDKALLRPGRFDRQVVVDRPDIRGRYEILKIHTQKIPLDKSVDLYAIARGTPGFSGADLANLVNESAILAARRNSPKVTMEFLEEAKDKVLMGPERKSLILSKKEKKITAYHEAGHTLMGILLKNVDPVYKVTIIPRGMALGVTQFLPIDDRHHYSKSFLMDTICQLLGGRVAEELVFKEYFTGAENDLQRATKIAHDMVCKWGMSELGPLQFGDEKENVFLGKDLVKERNFSEDTAKKIDKEIKNIVSKCYEKAKKLIVENKDKLDKIANALVEKESLNSKEIFGLLGLPSPEVKNNDEEVKMVKKIEEKDSEDKQEKINNEEKKEDKDKIKSE